MDEMTLLQHSCLNAMLQCKVKGRQLQQQDCWSHDQKTEGRPVQNCRIGKGTPPYYPGVDHCPYSIGLEYHFIGRGTLH
jgi:hypothetical protein